MSLTHGSLFTGVGGIDLGFDKSNIKTLWQCEIDKKARSVLAQHWPKAIRYTDVSKVDGFTVKPVDIITFGSPCQDLSIAGKRAGFQDGTRSNLYFEAVRIIKEMRHATKNQYPRYAVWENVRGALSSNGGQDFLAAIQALADIGAMDVSWRLVNTCYFGPPQRRVRVFVVADFGGERAGEILSEPTRVCWHPSTSGTSGQEATGTVTQSLKSRGFRMRGFGDYADDDTASAIKARDYKDATDLIVNNPILIDRAAFNQGINAQYNTHISDDPITPSLVARGPHAVATANNYIYQYDGYNQNLEIDGIHRTLRIGKDSGDFVAEPARASVPRMREGKPGGGKGPLLKEEMSLTLATANDQTLFQPALPTYRVRRLTPVECERLQGWPDDHTRWGEDDTEISDSARYKMIGNGVSAPVAQWLGENICAVHIKKRKSKGGVSEC